MGKTIFRAILLIGIGVVAGFVHAQYRGVLLKLPEKQPQNAASAAGVQADPAKPAPGSAPNEQPSDTPPQPVGPGPSAPPTEEHVQPPGPRPEPRPKVEPPVNPPAAEAPAENDWFISAAQAKEFYDKKSRGEWDGYFLDARPYHEYTEGHVPGAMQLDKNKVIYPKVRNYLKGMPVIIYCHGETCTDSEDVAKRLIALKYSIGPIHIIKEGFPGWQKGGYPVEKGGEVGFD